VNMSGNTADTYAANSNYCHFSYTPSVYGGQSQAFLPCQAAIISHTISKRSLFTG
jgi:hypothetical protein